ncbi:MAG: serine/threonine protein kinase [Planctomycetes bacterium]|nr:serine/threonine protein kinase [Planctomycetota bacterium]
MTERQPELSAVAEVFAQFLAGREQGGGDDIEPLCREHPRLAERLQRMHADWRRLEAALGPARPPVSRERYEVGACIAHGGMGAVYRVYDHHLRRELAMKVLSGAADGGQTKGSSDPRSLSRFLDEARVTGQLQHPGIPSVHDLGVDTEGRVFFTMPLVSGSTLREIVDAMRRGDSTWPLQRVLGVLMKVCEAVAFAHAQGVIHRDLKPSNVMVGRFGETYVMDWGLARVLAEVDEAGAGPVASERAALARHDPGSPLATRDGDVVGTPVYMPPEQARGDLARLGPRVDVYAAGAMLYHIVAGSPPYGDERASSQVVIRQILTGPPPPLEVVRPSTPPELAAICARAMAWQAEQRYRDMGELAADLRAWLEQRVVRAYDTGAFATLRKLVARNRLASVAVLAAFVAMGVGTAVSVHQARLADAGNTLALDAVERMLERVASNRLDDVPRAYPVRQDLIGDAIALYEQVLQRRGDDALIRARLARCWHQLGKVRHKLGDGAGSAEAQERAVAMFDQLVVEQPAVTEHVTARVDARLSLGILQTARGDHTAAEQVLRSAADDLDRLAAAGGGDRHLEQRFHVCGQLGTLLLASGRLAEATAERQRAVEYARRLAGVGDRAPAEERLARSLDQLGNCLFEADRPDAAAEPHREAVAILQALLAADPRRESVRASLGAALTNFGRCLDAEGRVTEALAVWRQSVQMWRAILDDHPEVPTYHWALGTTLGNIARNEADATAAVPCWHDAVQELGLAAGKAKTNRAFRAEWLRHLRDRAMWFAGRDRPRDVVQAAGELAAADLADGELALEAAIYVGRAFDAAVRDRDVADAGRQALLAECRAAGLAHVRAAIERGCRDRARFAAEHFDFLRGEPDFELLLAGLPRD